MISRVNLLINFLVQNRRILFHIPRSLYYNVRLFDMTTALRCPVFIHNSVKVNIGKNAHVNIKTDVHSGMVKIGFNTTNFYDTSFDKSVLTILGDWNIEGKVTIGPKSRISIGEGAKFDTKNLWVTGNILLIARKHIAIGDGTVFSWNITMMDHDAHGIFNIQGSRLNVEKEIVIGNHVWIGCNSTILKGTNLSDGVVVGANTVVSKKITDSNIILVGNPSVIKKRDISWGGFY